MSEIKSAKAKSLIKTMYYNESIAEEAIIIAETELIDKYEQQLQELRDRAVDTFEIIIDELRDKTDVFEVFDNTEKYINLFTQKLTEKQ